MYCRGQTLSVSDTRFYLHWYNVEWTKHWTLAVHCLHNEKSVYVMRSLLHSGWFFQFRILLDV